MPFRLLYGMASPAQHTGPGMMRGLAAADGVLVVPPHGVQLGEPVPAFALPWGAADAGRWSRGGQTEAQKPAAKRTRPGKPRPATVRWTGVPCWAEPWPAATAPGHGPARIRHLQ